MKIATFIISVIAIIFSACSFYFALQANWISKDANVISEDVLETTKHHFLQTNRPYIILSAKTFDDKQYWKVKQQGHAIKIILKYEIKNVGNVVAKHISLPNKVSIGPKLKLKEDAPVFFKRSNKVSLGPGDKMKVEPSISWGYENEEDAKKSYEYLISDKSEGVILSFSVKYTNELDESQRYRTLVENKIHNKKALIVKSEMIVLSDND